MILNGAGRPDGQTLAKETFPSHPSSFVPIRAFVKKWAEEAGVTLERISQMQLAVTEACANAMDHPKEKGDITLWAWRYLDHFTVDVSHAGEFRARKGQERRHRGMGLPLMVASTDEVSFASLPEGGTRVSLSVFLK